MLLGKLCVQHFSKRSIRVTLCLLLRLVADCCGHPNVASGERQSFSCCNICVEDVLVENLERRAWFPTLLCTCVGVGSAMTTQP